MTDELKKGREKYIEFPPFVSCEFYEKHKKEYGDYNVLGQIYRLECRLMRTDFDKPEDIKQLKHVVKDAAQILEKLSKESD